MTLYIIGGLLIALGIVSETTRLILKSRDEAGVAALRIHAERSDVVPIDEAAAAIHRAVKLAGDPNAGDEYLERVEALVIDELQRGEIPDLEDGHA